MKENDYIYYIDTDSLFIGVRDFLYNRGVTPEQWNKHTDMEKCDLVLRISKIIESYVEDRAYNETQKISYNSAVEDFKIGFKQEIVCKSILFVKKKKYGYNVVNEEGFNCDKIEVTGLEIIRSETPTVFRNALKNILGMILRGANDTEIKDIIATYKRVMKNAKIEDISSNIGVKNLEKYLGTGEKIKRTPWHVKGVWNYRFLLKHHGVENKYEVINEGDKVKVVYIKKNPYDIDTVSYHHWPKEFQVEVDFDKQYDKFFLSKVNILLVPMNREYILNNTHETMSLFFGE
jgi:hypothetical protein